ncbi:4-hydroxy-2-oxo-heptane-1,7-dioate aldolase [Rhodobacterales bacterium HKCCE2091]|nr:4-hydroxy-2-oxo-heptane-1,7-dioate aldolase [Rhodobacterales bacterium HKCCE2091]
MDLPRNTFKAALLEGRQQYGLWCSIADPAMAEMAAVCGYDWLLFDTEHSPISTVSVLSLLQAAAPYPSHAAVRPGSLDPVEIKRLLDLGAQTLLIPQIQSAEEARLAAAAVAYPPEGIRGVAGITRASRFGEIPDYTTRAREEICLMVQVETRAALEDLDAIVTTPGVDAVFIGPADLAASLGYPGQPSHPEVRRKCADAIRRIRGHGKPAGFLSLDRDVLEEMVEAGSLFTAIDIDTAILKRGAAATLAHWRAKG